MKRTLTRLTFACLGALVVALPFAALAQGTFHVTHRWTIGGEGGWDYLLADPASHHLYVTHGTRVEVLDLETGKVIGAVTGLTRCHGVVIGADGRTGFISDGGANVVVAFDTLTFAVTAKIPAGKNPDGLAYEPATATVWAFNGSSRDVTVIDANAKKPIGTIALPGKPEFPQVDGKGTVFVNIEDRNTIVRLDAKTLKTTATWALNGCDSPSGMAIDIAGKRLFSVCDGGRMAVTDSSTGKSLGTPSIGEGPDAAGFDAKSQLAFSSNGEGTLTIIDAGKPGYPVLQTLATARGARTMSFDPHDATVYLVTAGLAPVDPANPRTRPAILPGTFTVLAVSR